MTENDKVRTRRKVDAPAEQQCAAVLVYATFPSREAALAAGRALIEAGRAGCVNVLPAMTAIYRWKGVIETADEAVLIAKMPPEAAEAAVAHILKSHPYETPAVLVIPVIAGNPAYLDWVREGVRG